MKKIILTLSMAAAMIFGATGINAQNSDQPKGEPIITLFEHVGVGYNHNNDKLNNEGFNLERAYFGYRYTFDNNWSTTVIFDASENDGTGLEHAFVKNAFVRYQNGAFSMKAGIIPTEQGLTSEKMWGYRYAYKSFYDAYGWGSSADMGIELRYRFSDMLELEAMILNGEGFKMLQVDNQFLYTIGLTVKPISGLTLRLYADAKTADSKLWYDPISNHDYTSAQENISFFAGYDHQLFSCGAEFNYQANNANFEGHNRSGISLFGTYKMNEKINIFGRFDYGTSNDRNTLGYWNHARDCEVAMVGMQWKVNKNISLAPIFKYSQALRGGDKGYSLLYLSAKVAL